MGKRLTRARRSAGMSLIETTISLVVLSVGILGMIAAQVTALHQNNQGRHSTEAAQFARDQMEMMQRLPWAHPTVQVTSNWTAPRTGTTYVQRQSGAAADSEQQFDTSWRVTATGNPNLRRIDVRVQWLDDSKGGTTATRSYVMTALKVNE